MGLLSAILGNAAPASIEAVQNDLAPALADGERVVRCYQLVRDLFILTDRRIILVDKQGVTGKRVDIHSIPYRSITHFSVETPGNFDLDAELKIHILGIAEPLQRTFSAGANIVDMQRVLATFVAR